MSTPSKIVAAAALSLSCLVWAPPARADILDDILNIVNQARSQAEAAKNRATEARDSANEIRTNMRDAIANVTTEMRDMISEAVSDLQQQILEEKEGRDAWVNGPECETFRTQLIGLVDRMESLANAVLVIAGSDLLVFDFQREGDLLQAIPCRALYPLYRARLFDNSLIDLLDDAGNNLIVVAAVMQDDDDCTYTLGHLAEAKEAIANLQKNASYLRIVAKLLSALGKVPIQPQAGAWGWAGFVIKIDAGSKLAEMLNGIADALSDAADGAADIVKDCEFQGAIGELRANQERILQNQELIISIVNNRLHPPR